MKKLFLTVLVFAAAMTASAQVYVGGEAGFWRDWAKGANQTQFSILPEIGYNLDENWAIGTTIGYEYNYQKGTKINAFTVDPYARYTFAKLGQVNFFLDGGFGFYTYKVKGGDSQNAWEVGLKPGVSVKLTDKVTFLTHVGFLGYRDADEKSPFGENGFGFGVSGNNLSIGILYNF